MPPRSKIHAADVISYIADVSLKQQILWYYVCGRKLHLYRSETIIEIPPNQRVIIRLLSALIPIVIRLKGAFVLDGHLSLRMAGNISCASSKISIRLCRRVQSLYIR